MIVHELHEFGDGTIFQEWNQVQLTTWGMRFWVDAPRKNKRMSAEVDR